MDQNTYNEQSLALMASQYAQNIDSGQQLHNLNAYAHAGFWVLLVIMAFAVAYGLVLIGQLKPKAP